MTARASDRGGETEGTPSIHVVLATHSREVKTALFHSLNAISTVTIVATGTSTAELVSYCHAFRPDIAIIEAGLPGRPLGEVLVELGTSNPNSRILLIGEPTGLKTDLNLPEVEVSTDLDLLIATFPDQGADIA